MSLRCHLPTDAFSPGERSVSGEEAHHLAHVLRVKAGDAVECFDGAGRIAPAEVIEVRRRDVQLALGKIRHIDRPAPRIRLVQSLIKPSRLEWCLQKATELGAAEIQLVHTHRSVIRLDEATKEKRRQRWSRILINAGKQCGTAWLPALPPACTLDEALAPREGILLLADPGAAPLRICLAGLDRPAQVTVVVGPEGGLDEAERAACIAAGATPVGLGALTLRAETASLYLLSALGHWFDPA